jgi:hypothetical protein
MDKKRIIDSLYKNPSPATSSDKDKTDQNDALVDPEFKDNQMEEEERKGHFKKILKHLRK